MNLKPLMVDVETQTEKIEQTQLCSPMSSQEEAACQSTEHDESWNPDEEMSCEDSEEDSEEDSDEDEPTPESPTDQK